MPAPVPPGYTRGPILLIGPTSSTQTEATLLQRFWSEAGGYGARLLLLATAADEAALSRLTALFQSWETEAVTLLAISQRSTAQQRSHGAAIEAATAILLLDNDPLLLTQHLGGTPLAQALRRANARGKVIGGLGAGATALCQHMLLPGAAGQPPLAPGFGLVNRLGLAVQGSTDRAVEPLPYQLLTRISYNPFLIGVGLEPDTGIVVYPDTTLEVFGDNRVYIVDGTESDGSAAALLTSPTLCRAAGWQLHTLSAGYTFNFDGRTVHAPLPTDIPLSSVPGGDG